MALQIRPRNTVVGGGDKDPRWAKKVRSLEAALGALGPEDVGAEGANSGSPKARKGGSSGSASRHRQGRGSCQGGTTPESPGCNGRSWKTRGRCHKRALKKAQEIARERPIAELIKECKEFTKRISKLKDGVGDQDRDCWRTVAPH